MFYVSNNIQNPTESVRYLLRQLCSDNDHIYQFSETCLTFHCSLKIPKVLQQKKIVASSFLKAWKAYHLYPRIGKTPKLSRSTAPNSSLRDPSFPQGHFPSRRILSLQDQIPGSFVREGEATKSKNVEVERRCLDGEQPENRVRFWVSDPSSFDIQWMARAIKGWNVVYSSGVNYGRPGNSL